MLEWVFGQINRQWGSIHMINSVSGNTPRFEELAKEKSDKVAEYHRLLQLRTCPHRQHGAVARAIHVGLGLKWYAVSPTARKELLQMTFQHDAYELAIMSTLLNSCNPEMDAAWRRR